jgi:hypothetical protein
MEDKAYRINFEVPNYFAIKKFSWKIFRIKKFIPYPSFSFSFL